MKIEEILEQLIEAVLNRAVIYAKDDEYEDVTIDAHMDSLEKRILIQEVIEKIKNLPK